MFSTQHGESTGKNETLVKATEFGGASMGGPNGAPEMNGKESSDMPGHAAPKKGDGGDGAPQTFKNGENLKPTTSSPDAKSDGPMPKQELVISSPHMPFTGSPKEKVGMPMEMTKLAELVSGSVALRISSSSRTT